MKLPLFIAVRYINSKRTLQFISLISKLSMIGISVGVAALICVTSIFNGFRGLYQEMMLQFDPHIRIQTPAQFGSDTETLKILSNNSDISGAIRCQSNKCIVKSNRSIAVVELCGEDLSSGEKNPLANKLFLGNTYSNNSQIPTVIIGMGLSAKLGLIVGDTIHISSPATIENSILSGSLSNGTTCLVAGIYQTNNKEYDNNFIYTSFKFSSYILQRSNADYYDVRLKNFDEVEQVKKQLLNSLPQNVSILTWYDLHRDLYGIMQFERYGSFIVLSIIVLVAVFNIFALLTMTVLRKKSDIALLKSLGARDSTIRNIFITEGFFIGFVGTLIGLILGLSLCYGQIYFNWFALDTASFIVPGIPVRVDPLDVALVVIVTFTLTILATIFPSKMAATLPISSSLREE